MRAAPARRHRRHTQHRLARRLVAIYDARRAEGHAVWEAAVVLPWSAWLERLWQDVLVSDAPGAAPRVITPAQGAFLWKRIVAAERLSLIDERVVGRLAAGAWSIVHAWGAGGASWRGWSGGDDDRAAFVRWADEFSTGSPRRARSISRNFPIGSPSRQRKFRPGAA